MSETPDNLPDIRDRALHMLKGLYPVPGHPIAEPDMAARLVAVHDLIYNGMVAYFAAHSVPRGPK
jgi:hypothetical protein